MASTLDYATAQLGIPKPLAYGYVRARGNLLICQEWTTAKIRIAVIGLGEGEWDGIERFWINRAPIDHTNTAILHFHPGTDGVLGSGLSPVSLGGDQRVEAYLNLLPNAFPKITYSRLAYVCLYVEPDPAAPSADLDWLGDYRALKVRAFDNAGNETNYAFCTNPAWQVLDLFIRCAVKREALVHDPLLKAERDRFDWPSFGDSAIFCDEILANGQKRCESSVAFTQRQTLGQALQQLQFMSRCYPIEVGGKIYLYPDKPRAATFVVKAEHLAPSGFHSLKSQLRGAANQFVGRFNNLIPIKNCDIASIAYAGGATATVTTVQEHPFQVNDQVQIFDSPHAAFNTIVTVTNVPDATHFDVAFSGVAATEAGGWVGMPETRYTPSDPVLCDHEAHQLAVGQRGLGLSPICKRNPMEIDFGNNTHERVERLLRFWKTRSLGLDVTPYQAPWQAELSCWFGAVDELDRMLAAQLPGDVVTIDPSVSEEFQGDYEISEMQIAPASGSSDSSDAGATITLKLTEYISEAYDDTPGSATEATGVRPGNGLTPITTVDGDGNQVMPSSSPLNPQGSIIPNQSIIINYTVTATGIALSWSSQSMLRGDGSTLTVLAGTKSYTGLTASTLYYLYSYVRVSDGAIDFTNGTPPPTVPSAVMAAQAALDGRIAIPTLKVTTAAVGGTGGGTGGGGDVCPEGAELVEIQGRGQVHAIDAELGDYILGQSLETGEDVWRKVLGKVVEPCAAWRLVNGHRVSPCEEVRWDDAWVQAFRVPGAPIDTQVGVKVRLTVESDQYDESNYWLVEGERQLIHNSVYNPC